MFGYKSYLAFAVFAMMASASEAGIHEKIRDEKRTVLFNSRHLAGECCKYQIEIDTMITASSICISHTVDVNHLLVLFPPTVPVCVSEPEILSTPEIPPVPAPTMAPTPNPTASPTKMPTLQPSLSPTKNPTPNPTKNPTAQPTKAPTKNPTAQPTPSPTPAPTKNPTAQPTKAPTKNPTAQPTPSPTKSPTKNPTPNPTPSPTEAPVQVQAECPEVNLNFSNLNNGDYLHDQLWNSHCVKVTAFANKQSTTRKGFTPAGNPFTHKDAGGAARVFDTGVTSNCDPDLLTPSIISPVVLVKVVVEVHT